MFMIDDWHDLVRLVSIVVNLFALYLLFVGYLHHKKQWNEKTIDLWYSLMMWSLAGVVFACQGIFLDRDFTPGFVFLTAATLVGGKGVFARGSWGDARA